MAHVPTPLPSSETLHRLLRLDVETGELYWRPRTQADFVCKRNFNAWTTVYCGKPAAYNFPSTKYLRVRIFRQAYSAHRIVWKMVHGTDPVQQIDHIDRNPKNNRPSNLRDVSPAVNSRNKGPYSPRKDSETRVSQVA